MALKLVFMGTPEFAVPSLAEILAHGHEIVAVYTQPPRRAGRGKKLTPSPVHQFGDIMGLSVRTPDRFTRPSVINALEDLKADVACVVAYGQILPKRALEAPKYGCLNLHASLLPRWRGAAPIQRAIMAGDIESGVQIMQMAPGLDTGDIILSQSVTISDTDTAGRLSQRLSRIGAGLWPPVLSALERGAIRARPQLGEVSYATKIDKAEARINWQNSALDIERQIRGLAPFPGAWCEFEGTRVKIHLAQALSPQDAGPFQDNASPIKVGQVIDTALHIHCGAGVLRLLEVQPAGKSKMSAQDFVRGHHLKPGDILS